MLLALQDMGIGSVFRENALKISSYFLMHGAAERGECVEGWLAEDRKMGMDRVELGKAIVGREGGQIERMFSDGDSWSRRCREGRRDDSKRNVGEREVGRARNWEPRSSRHLNRQGREKVRAASVEQSFLKVIRRAQELCIFPHVVCMCPKT